MLPPKIINAYKKGAFGVFIGSGLSQASGLPSWHEFLEELVDLAFSNKIIDTIKKDELKMILSDSSKYLLLAEELREILKSDFEKFIRQRFDDKSLSPSETLNKVVKLESKFFITTNYDNLIEKAIINNGEMPVDFTYKDAASINYNLLNSEKFLVKAHGDARRAPNEIIITEKDYRNIIFKEKGYQSVLQVLFSTCNVLFLGVSLTDPDLKLLLGYIHNIFHGGSPEHFALMDNTKLTQTEAERWRKDFNIQILPYAPNNNHKELEDIIDELLTL